MRLLILSVLTFAMLCFASESWAGRVKIGGTHSSSEIQQTCGSVGGTFSSSGNTYSCVNQCGNDVCSVFCTSGSCTGSCPNCGRRDPSPLPVLGGITATSRALRNFSARHTDLR